MKNPNTPKQTVEAKYPNYKSSCCGVGVSVGGIGETHYYICNKCDKACDFVPSPNEAPCDHDDRQERNNPMFNMASLPEDTGIQKQGTELCWKCKQFYTPKEAPKGEADFFINTKPNKSYPVTVEITEVKKGEPVFDDDDVKPPSPDKEWEGKLRLNLDALFEDMESWDDSNGKLYADELFDRIFDWLKWFIRQLLKAKDQEADRRIEEVIGEIEDLNNSWDGDFFSMETDDWIKLKKKLSSK